MIAFHDMNIVVIKHPDAAFGVTGAIDDVPGTENAVYPLPHQKVDGRPKTSIFGMYITDEADSAVSHPRIPLGARDRDRAFR